MPYTHTHPFNGSFSRTTWVNHYLGRYSVDTVLVSQSSSSEGVATDHSRSHIHEMADNTHTFSGPFPGWASTREVKPIWISLKQETVSGSGISWTICKSAPCSRQITMPVFYRPDALPVTKPTASKHWRQKMADNCAIISLTNHSEASWPMADHEADTE